MFGRCEDYELRMALEPAHILLLASDGRRLHQRDPGTRRPQDDYDVRALQSSLSRTPAFRDRSHCDSAIVRSFTQQASSRRELSIFDCVFLFALNTR
jgi:hypothetical protein